MKKPIGRRTLVGTALAGGTALALASTTPSTAAASGDGTKRIVQAFYESYALRNLQ
ncbi:hypothetical protein ACGF0D_41365 [Kitasatospora sp. NPDC048298]|uniref:hypothetical protein n=1 Tax=Kitasatospora sp. NPDC048298 TaxID=3364049 RepID=UPI00371ED3C8